MLPQESVTRFIDSLRRALLVFLPVYLLVTVLLDLAFKKASWSRGYLIEKVIGAVIVAILYAVYTSWIRKPKTASNPIDDKTA
jgi:Ca2+/Na+ antiporter